MTQSLLLPEVKVSSPVDAPLRSELLGDEKFAEMSRQMAAYPAKVKRGSHLLHQRLRENEKALHAARYTAAEAAERNEQLMPDAEWLLDNFFVIEEVLREVQTDLPQGYYNELPVVDEGECPGLPRIYGIAVALVSHTDSHLDDARILRFVRTFQEVAPLTIGELWAIPTMLRLALLENLRRLGDQMRKTRSERDRALAWARRAVVSRTRPALPENPSDAFLVGWHQAIRDLGDTSPVLDEGETPSSSAEPPGAGDWLSAHAVGDLSEVLHREYRRQASNQVSVGNCVTSLRLLAAIDWNVFFERGSLVEETLQGEPTGDYRRQDFPTRNRYRHVIENLSKASGREEVEVARLVLARAAAGASKREQHIGYHLIAEGRGAFARELGCSFKFSIYWRTFFKERPYLLFFGSMALFTIAFVTLAACLSALAGAGPWMVVLVVVATLLPVSEAAVAFTNHMVCHLLPPRILPKFDFSSGIPTDYRTMVVIPGMLFKPESAATLCERLELHYLSNPDSHLRFALLTDWADAPMESMPEDDSLVKAAMDGIRKLNERYSLGGPDLFFLFHRKRQFNPSEGVWMGWERKRGKLDEFNRVLRGATNTSYIARTGNAANLDIRFVLTVDTDTVLPRDSARRLVGTLAHPLNRPVLSTDGRRVVAGYGVIQPRISFLYKTGLRSLFARIFAGSAGIDPYSSASSDVYQDLYGSGTFTGKGLYDVDAFQATAGRAFPENHILSHDLIESNFARCGLATDIELFDDFPAKYHAYARREHRWIRGDWQLLPWLGRQVPTPEGKKPNPLTAIGRWKVFDNLRRSLVPVSLLVLLVLGWTALPGYSWAWSLVAMAVLAMPLVMQLFDHLTAFAAHGTTMPMLRGVRKSVFATAGQLALTIVFLANQTVLAINAISLVLYRLFISHERMLEWETAAATEARLGNGLRHFLNSMGYSLVLAVALTVLVALVNPAATPAAAPWIVLWLLSPVVAWLVSRPLPDREPVLSQSEQRELRRTARKTWNFFDTFVTVEDNWLPPDNFQEDPKGVLAHRTSPTNKGLFLLSTLSAHDLGYISLPSLAVRIERTLDSFDKMERFRGHFLNWYETTTLRPLTPAYVSTVDSGNLLGCLLALKNGLLAKGDEPVPSRASIDGLLDTLELAEEQLPASAIEPLRKHLAIAPGDLLGWDDFLEQARKLTQQITSTTGETSSWIKASAALVQGLRDELASICPWLPLLRKAQSTEGPGDRGPNSTPPEKGSGTLAKWLHELNTPGGIRYWVHRLPAIRAGLAAQDGQAEMESLAESLDHSAAGHLAIQLDNLIHRLEQLTNEMDFKFLYNESRHLFSIGYNVPLERLDGAYYDLLASEASLTSYLAVARGIVPRKHWFQLSRFVTRTGGSMGLLSWGGTMFEYLMPRLLLAPPRGTMLEVAQNAAVQRQREYGMQTHTPWGVSESGFYALSPEEDYQYQSFGVPGLGLKRGLGKDLVVAPYATLLATMVEPREAIANFKSLRAAGGEGPFGFYEALDFTATRMSRGEKCQVVKSYMAHHQGMGLCAITNRLTNDIHCRRFSAEPAVRAAELLLQERVPFEAPELLTPKEETVVPAVGGPDVSRRLTTYDTPAPRSHLLSNGNYTVMVTNAGGGFSTCGGTAVTRWRDDPTRDNCGTFIYIRDQITGRVWSAGYQPLGVRPDQFEAIFSTDKAELARRDHAIETRLAVTVAPDQDAEIRRITLINHDTKPHVLEVTSYVEIVLSDQRADLAHPAFGKLFLETEWLPQHNALLCRRRMRAANQQPVFAVHLVSGDETVGRVTEHETDRARFLGRRRFPSDAASLNHRLSSTVGPVLDPVFSLRKTVRLGPGGSGTLAFATAICQNRASAVALADHYRSPAAAERAFDLAWARSRVELQHLGVTAADSHVFQRLAGHILFPPPQLRAPTCLRENRLGQSGLWRFGISGDLPIITVCVSDGDGLPLARQALKAHAFWRGRSFVVDLVLLADRPTSYREELYQDLSSMARSSDSRDLIDKPGGVFVRKVQPSSEERTLILAASRVTLYGDRGTLADQTDALGRRRGLPPELVPVRPAEPNIPDRPEVKDLEYFNGFGGFAKDSSEYVVTGTPPAPWINVIASPNVGCLATDTGLGCTWVGNSQANRLTQWSNDAVSDPPSEVVYVRDEETGHIWTPTPRPSGAACAVWHGHGYTSYAADRDGLTAELTVFVSPADPVKILKLRVSNRGARRRLMSAAYFAEWVLGATREQSAPFIVTEIDPTSGTMFARCSFNSEFGNTITFADTSLRPRSFTGDRTEFIGRNGTPAKPAALRRVALSNHVGPGLDPCAALMGRFEVPPNDAAEVVFVIGQAADVANASRLAAQYRQPAEAVRALREVIASWERRISTLRVKTPDRRFDVIVNQWLLYQVLSCRVWGRSAFYQSSGAYGFRDQLQDVMALLYAEPSAAREHILRAASRQFVEGDVQHWWHPPSGRGVRTRFSDDFLWLPYVVARYIEVTGDAAILDADVSYIRGTALRAGEQEDYFTPDLSDNTEHLYNHCLRALTNGWKLGPHGLPLMGCGDWNDGMNLVGAGGTGESVWVGWFQIVVRSAFATLAENHDDHETAKRLREEVKQLREAMEAHAWDGSWYLRAWFDDGTPLGSHTNDECRIDSITQSWAVLAGGDTNRAKQAVDSAISHLVDSENKLVKLFEPPFDTGTLQPGYIKGYVPGIRENGGQYTHAAIWLVQALAGLSRGSDAYKLWMSLNPLTHSDTTAGVECYKVEPYVVAADVYGVAPNIGRGGWTWYTGSASWLYRAAVETILGFTKRGDRLSFDPHIPSDWAEFEIEFRYGETLYRCRIENPDRSEGGIKEVWLDGNQLPDQVVPLRNDGHDHSVRVIMTKT